MRHEKTIIAIAFEDLARGDLVNLQYPEDENELPTANRVNAGAKFHGLVLKSAMKGQQVVIAINGDFDLGTTNS